MRWNTVRTLLEMNLRELSRDFGAVFFSFVFPLIFVVSLGVTDTMNRPFKFEVGVVAATDNPHIDRLSSALEASGVIATRRLTIEAGDRALKDGDVKMLVIVPSGSLTDGQASVRAVVEPRFAAFARMAIETVRAQFAASEASYRAPFQISVEQPTFRPVSEFSFVFPGLLAIALLQLGMFATATPLLRARDRGTLRHLGTTPVSRITLVVVQLMVRLLVASAQLAILLGVAAMVFKVPIAGNWASLVLAGLLGAAMLIALGYALAGIAPSFQAGMTIIMIANFAMIFGGNVFWNLADAPEAARIAMHLIPLTYLSDMLRQIVSGLSGLFPLWFDVLMVSIFTLLGIVVATRTFRFEMEGN